MASLPFCSKKNNKRSSVFPKFISCVLIFHVPNSIAFNIKRNIIIKWLSNELAISKFQSINSIWFTLIGSMQLFGSQRYRKHYRIATKISEIWLAMRTSIFAVSVQGAQYDNIAQCKDEKNHVWVAESKFKPMSLLTLKQELSVLKCIKRLELNFQLNF